jgi:hypothetical protein
MQAFILPLIRTTSVQFTISCIWRFLWLVFAHTQWNMTPYFEMKQKLSFRTKESLCSILKPKRLFPGHPWTRLTCNTSAMWAPPLSFSYRSHDSLPIPFVPDSIFLPVSRFTLPNPPRRSPYSIPHRSTLSRRRRRRGDLKGAVEEKASATQERAASEQ